jgi:hypothetical protein
VPKLIHAWCTCVQQTAQLPASRAKDARAPDREYPGAELVSAKDIVRLLRMIKNDAELCVLVRGDVRNLHLRELRVITQNVGRADQKTLYFLPSQASLMTCINIVVYLADARHLTSPFGMSSLGNKVIHLAGEMRRLIDSASTLVVCIVHDEDCPPSEVEIPKGFPHNMDENSAEKTTSTSTPSPTRKAHTAVSDDVTVIRIDANSADPIDDLATRIGLLVNLSDRHRSITQSMRGIYNSRAISSLLTPRTVSWILRRVAPADGCEPS